MKPSTRWLLGLCGVLLAGVLLAAASLAWMLRSESGSAWLLGHVPGLHVSGGKGKLLGDFEAQRVQLRLGAGGTLVLEGFGWKGLRIERSSTPGAWLRVAMAQLHAQRLELQAGRSGGESKPLTAPADLRLPVEAEIGALRIDELRASALGEQPLRDLQARIHLGAERGEAHRVDGIALAWDRLRATGSARIASAGTLPLDLRVDLLQQGDAATTSWRASARLTGPLQQPALQATLRAAPDAPGKREQSLELQAVLRPFADWPLAELQASTRELDLSALHRAAPITALSGEAQVQTTGLDQPANLNLKLSNADAGSWNEGRLPVRSLNLSLRGRPKDTRTLELQSFDAELGTQRQTAGRLQGRGQWAQQQARLDVALSDVQPSLLDTRALAAPLAGTLTLLASGLDAANADARVLDVKADLSSTQRDKRRASPLNLRVDASVNALRIDLRDAQARAGPAHAALSGAATRSSSQAPWQLKGKASLADFDPAVWWPGPDNPAWRQGPHRINAKGIFDLSLPIGSAASGSEWLAATRGDAALSVVDSLLAGVALSGEVRLRHGSGDQAEASLKLDAAGNVVRVDGRLATAGSGSSDQWDLTLSAAQLNRLSPLWRMVQAGGTDARFAGALSGSARIRGRWPDMASQGQLEGKELRAGVLGVQQAQARWQLGTAKDAVMDVQATLSQLSVSAATDAPPLESLSIQVAGTAQAHTLALRAQARALPPAWAENLQAKPAPGVAAPTHSVASLQAQGSVIEGPSRRAAGWRGKVQQLELRSNVADVPPWVRARDLSVELQAAGGPDQPARATLEPGRVELLGGVLRWSRVAWQGAGASTPAQLDAQAELEPIQVAPLLARLQPAFGWGGDLALAGHVNVRSAPAFTADVVLERQRGDLTVTDETGTQSLGLSDLRLALDAHDGVWSFTQALAGKTLGVAAGALVARTAPGATWPSPDTPIQGVVEVQVAHLGTWGNWVPAGWRLEGALRTTASIAGRFGAPEYTGEVRGQGLGVRNFVQGVNVSDGEVAVALQGSSARIERFSARAGAGTARLEGSAQLGSAPSAQLSLHADRFQLLGRVDRRIVTTGDAQLRLDSETLDVKGNFMVDEGLVDFTRSDAPTLSDDVEVVRAGKPVAESSEAGAGDGSASNRKVALNLQVDLGQQLRLRGRGLDTGLRGDLRITAPGGRLALNGSVRTSEGTYRAYGQKLTIDRGQLNFNGPIENPRLDIEATRPNLDTRVGVAVTGTALNPRVRLFSEPEMSDTDKLSWLVLGRAPDGLGRTDTALLQRAALALLSGEGEGFSDQLTHAIGLDEMSLRQSEGEVRETVISLGKQVSRRWYVGYERSLNATTGTWQLIYRMAQRFTLRGQAGFDNSVDAIWTWRWQ